MPISTTSVRPPHPESFSVEVSLVGSWDAVCIGPKDMAVDGNRGAKRSFGELWNKGSEDRSKTESVIRALSFTNLIVPVALQGSLARTTAQHRYQEPSRPELCGLR